MRNIKHFHFVILIPLSILAVPLLIGAVNPQYMRPFMTTPGMLVLGIGVLNNLTFAVFMKILWISFHSEVFQKQSIWLRLPVRSIFVLLCLKFLAATLAIYALAPAALSFVGVK